MVLEVFIDRMIGFRSFLTNRKQYVSIDHHFEDDTKLLYGNKNP